MIAIRRLLFRGWGNDTGMRIHIVQPSPADPQERQQKSVAAQAAADRQREDFADRQRRQIETMWVTHGGR